LSFLLKQEFRIGLNATWVCALQEWVQPELAGNPMVAQSRIPAALRLVTSQKAADSLKNTSLGLQIILLFIRSIHFELRPATPKLSTLPVSSVYTR